MRIPLGPVLVAFLLAVPAPGPLSASIDVDSIVENVRSPRVAVRPERSKQRRPDAPVITFEGQTGALLDPSAGWNPRRFSRPPPSL